MVVEVDLKPLNIKGIGTKRPLIMAGPCSAESEEQVLVTAREIAALLKGLVLWDCPGCRR